MGFQNDIDKCMTFLKEGSLILYPTDTIWGIGCDATNEDAVKKLIELKQRPDSKSFVILVRDIDSIPLYADPVPPAMLDYKAKAGKPVTFILNNAHNLAPSVINTDGTVAIRIPEDDFCRALLVQYGNPVVSTSANVSGQPAPAIFPEITETIRQGVGYTVLHRRSDPERRAGSSIIKAGRSREIIVIRP